MPKTSKLMPEDAYEVWKHLMLAGNNVFYALSLFWEVYQKELSREHDPDLMQEEMGILKSELDYFRKQSHSGQNR